MKKILILPFIVLSLMLALTLKSSAQTVNFVTLYSTNTGPEHTIPRFKPTRWFLSWASHRVESLPRRLPFSAFSRTEPAWRCPWQAAA